LLADMRAGLPRRDHLTRQHRNKSAPESSRFGSRALEHRALGKSGESAPKLTRAVFGLGRSAAVIASFVVAYLVAIATKPA